METNNPGKVGEKTGMPKWDSSHFDGDIARRQGGWGMFWSFVGELLCTVLFIVW